MTCLSLKAKTSIFCISLRNPYKNQSAVIIRLVCLGKAGFKLLNLEPLNFELSLPDWEATYPAPWGPIRAGDIFAAWVAHDLLHMRQLVKLLWEHTASRVEPYETEYAGEW